MLLMVGVKEPLLTLQQSVALLNAIKEYENNKWKEIGKKVGKPAKVKKPGHVIIWVVTLTKYVGMRAICQRALQQNIKAVEWTSSFAFFSSTHGSPIRKSDKASITTLQPPPPLYVQPLI